MCGFSGELAIKDTADPCAVVRMTQAVTRAVLEYWLQTHGL